jgi:hypothetical protein
MFVSIIRRSSDRSRSTIFPKGTRKNVGAGKEVV